MFQSSSYLVHDIVNNFIFLDFKKCLKVGLSAVGKTYIASGILQDGLTCICMVI